MLSKVTDRYQSTVHAAARNAASAGRDFIVPLDIMLAVLKDESIASLALLQCGVTIEHVASVLAAYQSSNALTEAIGSVSNEGWDTTDKFDSRVQSRVHAIGHNYAGPEHLVLALCDSPSSMLDSLLLDCASSRIEVASSILDILGL